MAVSLSAIMEMFKDEVSILKKAENKLDSNHLTSITHDGELNVIRAQVMASMKKVQYNVEVSIT